MIFISKTKIFSEEEKQSIIYEYTILKKSSAFLGERYGCSSPTILKNLKQWNIQLNSRKLDLTNKHFGELTAIQPAQPRNDRYTRWICKCSCGNIVEVRTDFLTSGHTTSCGHLKEQCFGIKDLIGQKFGKLTVLENCSGGKKKCKCSCGNIVYAETDNLLNGNTQSCGCLKSKGELKINQILTEIGINFKTQYSFEDCRFPDTKRLAYFDYAIFSSIGKLLCLIEYDGNQHYVGWNQNKESLNKIKAYDAYKNYYCLSHNISLIRIPYTDYEKINKNYIKNILEEFNDGTGT